jgi:hypothetical protein
MENAPHQILLVAPRPDMASILSPFLEEHQEISAWLSDLSDNIYQAIMHHNVTSLTNTLDLSSQSARPLPPSQLILDQATCILRIEHNAQASPLSYDEVLSVLKEIDIIKPRVDWWYLWLIQQQILLIIQTDGHYTLTLNNKHLAVEEIYAQRDVLIDTFQNSTQDGEGMLQNTLLDILKGRPQFRDIGDAQEIKRYIEHFLHILNDEGLVYIDTRPVTPQDQPQWYLNTSALPVVKRYAPRYLPLLILGIDHFLVRDSHPIIYEDSLAYRIPPYVEERFVTTVYQMALDRQWLQRRTPQQRPGSYYKDNHVTVSLNEHDKEVQEVLLKRDLLLDTLYRKGERRGITRRDLWSSLCENKRSKLKRNEMDEWLTIFQLNGLLLITPNTHDSEQDCLRLHPQSQLAHRLLGRMHIWWVILVLRIIGAKYPEKQKPVEEASDRMSQIYTHINNDLAHWAIEYAKSIKLVECSKQKRQDDEVDVLYLKRHSFVARLDYREHEACKTLVRIVTKLTADKRRFPDGRVPRPLVIQEMEKEDCFGQLQSEHDYWINQAIHQNLLVRHFERIPRRPVQIFLQIRSQMPVHTHTRVPADSGVGVVNI